MILEAVDILKLLPHRFPFLYIDRAEYKTKGRVRCYKNVSIGEPIFQGHFGANPIFPGVLLIECGAQAAAVMYLMDSLTEGKESFDRSLIDANSDISEKVGFLASIKNFSFSALVRPGDTIAINCAEEQSIRNASLIRIMITNQHNKKVAEGLMTVTSGGGAKNAG
jgi:3-hydroxyacyl-[acyl-carrier-protein] dehydratase